MTIACYCRVSPNSKSESAQRREINKWLVDHRINQPVHWFVERHGEELSELRQLRSDIANGAIRTIIVCSVDRLSLSFSDGVAVLSGLLEQGIRVVATSQKIDIDGKANPSAANLVTAVSQMAFELHREKHIAGIAAAKERGAFKGRKKGALKSSNGPAAVAELRATGMTYNAICQRLGLSKPTAIRYFKIAKSTPLGIEPSR